MEELVTGDETVVWAVTLVVNNLGTHLQTLHDLQKALHHAVRAKSAGEIGRGVVSGSVLFTPNAVIFDPEPSDPLVEELEPEAFQIIAPMEFVVNAAIFNDFFPVVFFASDYCVLMF